MSRIKVKDASDLEIKFVEAVRILYVMRKHQKHWHNVFGKVAKDKKDEWEEKADRFLETLEITNGAHINSVTIEPE